MKDFLQVVEQNEGIGGGKKSPTKTAVAAEESTQSLKRPWQQGDCSCGQESKVNHCVRRSLQISEWTTLSKEIFFVGKNLF